jgi:hypothetical protein
MNKTLLEISQTKNAGLSEVLVNWKNYDQETVILAISELKKRNIPFNDEMQNLLSGFTQYNGKSVTELEQRFFLDKGVSNYEEYYQAKINVLEKSDEEKLLLDQLRRERIHQLGQLEKKQAGKDVLYGALWLGGGLVVTLISLSNGRGGVIAYGAIIFGGIQFFRGLMKS